MQIKSLKLINFYSHKDTFIEFAKDASISVVGKNGSGKSSIIEGIYYALTGKLFRASNLSESVRDGAESNSVEIIITHRDKEYSILREYYKDHPLRKKYLLVRSRLLGGDKDWNVLSSRSITKEWNVLEHLFGVDAESLRYAPIVAQGDIDSFGLMTKSDKRQLIINLLLEGKIAYRVGKQIKNSLSDLSSSLAEVTAEKTLYTKDLLNDEQATELLKENDGLKSQIEKLELEINNKKKFGRNVVIARILQAIFNLADFNEKEFVDNIKKYQDDYSKRITNTKNALRTKRAELNARLDEYRDRYIKLRLETEPIEKLEKEIDFYRRKSGNLMDSRKKRDSLISRLSVLEKVIENKDSNDENSICIFCGRPLSKHEREELKSYFDRTEKEIAQIRREIKDVDKIVNSAQEAQTKLSRKSAQLSYLRQKKDEMNDVLERGKSISSRLKNPKTLVKEVLKETSLDQIVKTDEYKNALLSYIAYRKIKTTLVDFTLDEMTGIDLRKYASKKIKVQDSLDVTALADEIEKKRQALAFNQLRINKSEQAKNMIAALDEKIQSLKTQIKSDTLLYDVLSPTTGAFALALDDILGDLSRITTQYATIIDNDVVAVEFISRKYDDDGSDAPTLDIKIVRRSSGTRSFSQLSGGEKSKISFAIRIAISTLLLNNKEIEFLILDEALVYLDVDSRAKVVELIKTMSIPQILIISHDEDLANAYTDLLYVEKIDGVSNVRFMKG